MCLLRQGRKRVRDRDTVATGIEQVEIVLGITDTDDMLRGHLQFAKRFEQAAALVDASWERHDGPLVPNDHEIQVERANRLDNPGLVVRPGCDDDLADGERRNVLEAESRDEVVARGHGDERVRAAGLRTIQDGAVLADDTIENRDRGKRADEIVDLAARHQQQLTARRFEAPQAVEDCRLDDAVFGQRVVKVHGDSPGPLERSCGRHHLRVASTRPSIFAVASTLRR